MFGQCHKVVLLAETACRTNRRGLKGPRRVVVRSSGGLSVIYSTFNHSYHKFTYAQIYKFTCSRIHVFTYSHIRIRISTPHSVLAAEVVQHGEQRLVAARIGTRSQVPIGRRRRVRLQAHECEVRYAGVPLV